MTKTRSARRFVVPATAAVWVSLALALPALAQGARTDLNLDTNGVMLKGYDPVAYFTEGEPTKGTAEFVAVHDGATCWFASAENRDAFEQAPEKYAPAFGGYCAMGVVFNKKIDIDPTIWRIVDGKLYVNVSDKAAQRWKQDLSGNIAKGNTNWPQIKAKPPADL